MIPEQLTGCDWEAAFQFVEPPNSEGWGEANVSRALGYEGSVAGFSREDVAEVVAAEEGENDGQHWIALLRLTDGRIAFLTAGCDYTGWDCQSSGYGIVGGDVDSVVRLALGDGDRARLADQIAKWEAS